MLKISNLCKKYIGKYENTFSLNNVNFDVNTNSMCFILGKSGCGKSTLLNLIGGVDTFDSGEIEIDGIKLSSLDSKEIVNYRNSYVGFVFQNFNLLEDYTVFENVNFALEFQNIKDKQRVYDCLEKVGLKDYVYRNVKDLSGGQKQRVAIARAIVKKPRILICDEPTGSLDKENSKLIFDLLKKISEETLVILASHDRQSAEIYADQIIELVDGSVVNVTKKKSKQANEEKQSELKKYKSSFKLLPKLGFKMLLKKPVQFIMACLLSVISVCFGGVSLGLIPKGEQNPIYKSLMDNKTMYFNVQRYDSFGNIKKSFVNDKSSKLEENEINFIKEQTNNECCFVSNLYNDISINFNKHVDSNLNPFFVSNINGICEINDNLIEKLDFEIVCGDLPKHDDEIVITKYLLDVFNYKELKSDTITFAPTESSILNSRIKMKNDILSPTKEFKIVGVIDTNLNDDITIENCQNTQSKELIDLAGAVLSKGLHNVVFVNDGYLNRNYKGKYNMPIYNCYSTFYSKSVGKGTFIAPKNYTPISEDISSLIYNTKVINNETNNFGIYIPLSEYNEDTIENALNELLYLYTSEDLRYEYDGVESIESIIDNFNYVLDAYGFETKKTADFLKDFGRELMTYYSKNDFVIEMNNEVVEIQILGFYDDRLNSENHFVVMTNPLFNKIIDSGNGLYNTINYSCVFIKDYKNYKNLIKKINDYDFVNENVQPNGSDVYLGSTLKSSYSIGYSKENFESTTNKLSLIFVSIAGVFTIISILCFYIFFGNLAHSEKRNIGILRCLGSKDSLIVCSLLFISISSTILIGTLGSIASLIVSNFINGLLKKEALFIVPQIELSFPVYLYIFGIAFVCSLLSLLISIKKYLKDKPVDVIKPVE